MDSKIRFVVPVAFSPQTDTIVEQSCNLAIKYDAEVNLLYVFDTSRSTGIFAKKEHIHLAKEEAQTKFDELANRVRKRYNLDVKATLIEGKVYDVITSFALAIGANIIIMGTNGAVGIKSQFIGSNTMKVIKGSPCPVLTIRGKNHRKGCSNIVLPLDLTKQTTQKVEHAVDFAKVFGDSIIRAVSIINTTDKDVNDKLVVQMQDVRESIEKEGVECVAEIVKVVKGEDNLPLSIIAYAEKVNADVIMIMTQQESNPTELFIGSRAQTVINKSAIPVMSISPRNKGALNIL